MEIDNLKCKFFKNKWHLLKQPVLLPCNNTACLSCIQSALNKNNCSMIKCNFPDCKQKHIVGNAASLPLDKTTVDKIDANLDRVCFEMQTQLVAHIETTKGCKLFEHTSCKKYVNRRENLESRVEIAINDIELKIESLKLSLDQFGEDLKNTIDFTRANYNRNRSMFMLDLKVKQHEPETLNFARNLRDILTFIDKQKFSKQADLIGRFGTVCAVIGELSQAIVNDVDPIEPLEAIAANMNKITDEYNTFIGKDLYKPNKSIPCTSFAGKFANMESYFNTTYFEKTLPTVLTLKDNRTIRGFCSINDRKLLLADPKTNVLCVMDEHFREIQRIKAIGKHKLEYPCGVCTDGVEYVYICDHDNNRVLIAGLDLATIVKILGKAGKTDGMFDCPMEICYHSNCIYVLDRGNKRIQVFTRSGLFLRSFSLYRMETNLSGETIRIPLILPTCLNVVSKVIGVLSISKIYLYGHNNDLLQTLDPNNFKCFCFINNRIYAYTNESNLISYVRNYERNRSNGTVVYVEDFSIKLNGLKKIQATCMALFNGRLIVSIDFEKQIAII